MGRAASESLREACAAYPMSNLSQAGCPVYTACGEHAKEQCVDLGGL